VCRALVALAIPACATACAGAPRDDRPGQPTGFLDRTVAYQGAPYRYQVYVPPTHSPDRAWPVILFLHGAGERGTDGLRPTHTGLAGTIRWQREWFPAVVVFPQVAWPDSFWAGAAEAIALQALDAAVAEFHGDPDRIYLTGLSMGGFGTWRTAAEHPDRFAAIVVAAGGLPDPLPVGAPAAVADPHGYVASRVRDVPAWIFHGAADSATLADTRLLVAALRHLEADVRYTEYAAAGHDESWQRAFDDPELWQWVFGQRRSRR
jgi:predicted peptidase